MSLDCKSFAEYKDPQTGRWTTAKDVFAFSEEDKKYSNGRTHTDNPFGSQKRDVFCFLADERNADELEFLPYQEDLPMDVSIKVKSCFEEEFDFVKTAYHLYLSDFIAFDYDKTFLNKWENRTESYRTFLGEYFFQRIEDLKKLGKPDEVRVVFWFY